MTSEFDDSLIENRITELRKALNDSTVSTEEKINILLRNEEITLMLLLNDHSKVLTMWGVFRPLAWTTTIATVGIIGLAIAGHISIAIVP